MKKIINKPWGSEELISLNKNYCLKKLKMLKGHRCSLQYHKKKHETIYVLKGALRIFFGKTEKKLKEITLKENQSMIIEPLTIHRMEAVKNSIYLEASTSQLKDVVRILDDYGR